MTDLSRAVPGPSPVEDHEPQSPITVRRVRWDLPHDLGQIFTGRLAEDCDQVALSLTLPYLEPYLIRTLRSVASSLPSSLAADVRAFCAQEAHHHRNHARANEVIRDLLGPETAGRLLEVEAALDADYRRFSETRATRWNLAYAEGFEAMTCALALTAAEAAEAARRAPSSAPAPHAPPRPPTVWQQLWAWHLAEEVEHRSVAFDVFEHVCGRWPYRVAIALRAQLHIRGYLARFHRILMEHHGHRSRRPYVPALAVDARRRILATYARGYDPAAIEPPPAASAVLATL